MTFARNPAAYERLRHVSPDSRETQIAHIHHSLAATQWWSADRLRQLQNLRLTRLIGLAQRHVPFYAGKLEGLIDAIDGSVIPAAWATLPLLTKAQIRSDGARLRSQNLPSDTRLFTTKTSGSTGVPLELVQTAEFWDNFYATKLRLLTWHSVDLRHKTIEILPPRGAPRADPVRRLPAGESPFNAIFDSGPYLRVSIFTAIEWQLELLEREAPQYLLTQPSNLRLLLRELRRSGRRIPSLRLVRTQAGQLDPDLRTECREVLGVPLVDVYGATEAGYIAFQCPKYDHYHVQSELNLVEVLGDDGRPCQPGQTGRIVVTPLFANVMPLFRYDLGDYAEVGPPCDCGRGLPVLRRIFGRQTELLTLPSGEKRFSTFGSRIFTKIPSVAQFQIAQTSRTEIEVRIVADQPLNLNECAEITSGLTRQIGTAFTIRLKFVNAIPRTPGGKFMEFVSEIDKAIGAAE